MEPQSSSVLELLARSYVTRGELSGSNINQIFSSNPNKEFKSIISSMRSSARSQASQLESLLVEKFPGMELGLRTISSSRSAGKTGGEWDWWSGGKLSLQEKSRLRKNWMSKSGGPLGGSPVDIIFRKRR